MSLTTAQNGRRRQGQRAWRRRHRQPRSPGRAADRTHQRTHAPLQDPRQGPPRPPRPAEDGQPAQAPAVLPEGQGRRPLHRADPETGPAQVRHDDRALATRPGLSFFGDRARRAALSFQRVAEANLTGMASRRRLASHFTVAVHRRRHEHVQQGHQDLPVGPAHGHDGNRRDRPPVHRRRAGRHRRHRRAGDRRRAHRSQVGAGLLPADRRLHREDLRRRQDPRQLLQARRPPERAGDADLAPDRPPDPPAVPRRLLQRSPGRHPRAEPEPRGAGRHRRADRHQRRAGDLRHPVQRPDRRRARRLHQRRVRAQPGPDRSWPTARWT